MGILIQVSCVCCSMEVKYYEAEYLVQELFLLVHVGGVIIESWFVHHWKGKDVSSLVHKYSLQLTAAPVA